MCGRGGLVEGECIICIFEKAYGKDPITPCEECGLASALSELGLCELCICHDCGFRPVANGILCLPCIDQLRVDAIMLRSEQDPADLTLPRSEPLLLPPSSLPVG